jgi:superfamily II DNA/RNA helicase
VSLSGSLQAMHSINHCLLTLQSAGVVWCAQIIRILPKDRQTMLFSATQTTKVGGWVRGRDQGCAGWACDEHRGKIKEDHSTRSHLHTRVFVHNCEHMLQQHVTILACHARP